MGQKIVRREHYGVKPPKPCHTWVKVGLRTVCMTCGELMPVKGQIDVCRKPSGVNRRAARLSGWVTHVLSN
jgi:hypothetical protein